jgi:putative drug exporter of the RND superfamily
VFGFVLLFAFLLMLVSFRSIVIAVKAIVLNVLSVGAAYGVLVAVFQWGWGESLLDFESNGGIERWLPMFLFVILFGLSMDYHVFILSRIREAYDRGLSNDQAVAHGIKSTASVVTSAATVMVGTFAVFAILPVTMLKEMGIGLAAAVLIDATIVRAVLLPATMKLLGDQNWYLPRRLEGLPRLEHEGAPEAAACTGHELMPSTHSSSRGRLDRSSRPRRCSSWPSCLALSRSVTTSRCRSCRRFPCKYTTPVKSSPVGNAGPTYSSTWIPRPLSAVDRCES